MKQTTLVSTTSVDLSSLITLEKLQSRVPSTSTIDDTLFALYRDTAIKLIEEVAEITLVEKTYDFDMVDFPSDKVYMNWLRLRIITRPVTSIVSVKYYDEDDTQQTLSSSSYETWLDALPPSVIFNPELLPSSLSSSRLKAVTVRFTAGYTTVTSFPPGSKLAILELVAYWYQNREAFGRLPDGVQGRVFQSLIDTLRWRMYP